MFKINSLEFAFRVFWDTGLEESSLKLASASKRNRLFVKYSYRFRRMGLEKNTEYHKVQVTILEAPIFKIYL